MFINDLFPKDWQSFFIGRDEDYLKAPSDALRLGLFAGRVNFDLTYTPTFDPDRYIRGERISFWDPIGGGFRGDADPLLTDVPDETFEDDEIALRIYGNAGSYEVAGYGYSGFWKSPAGVDPVSMRATFPALDVWGASVRGPLGPGIGNVEIGYYDSKDDPDGRDPFVNNSEFRLLVGYEVELARELTGGFQYYLERMEDHDRYLDNLPGGASPGREPPRADHAHHQAVAGADADPLGLSSITAPRIGTATYVPRWPGSAVTTRPSSSAPTSSSARRATPSSASSRTTRTSTARSASGSSGHSAEPIADPRGGPAENGECPHFAAAGACLGSR